MLIKENPDISIAANVWVCRGETYTVADFFTKLNNFTV